MRYILLLFALMLVAPAGLAQDNCSPVVETALQQVEQDCSGTGLNQACYGNVAVQAEVKTSTPFEFPGDLVDVTALASLQTFPLDAAAGTWGIVLLRLQADVADTLPGQSITMLLFGEVDLQPVEIAPPVTLEITATGNPNVRNGPGTTYNVVGSLSAAAPVTANGRNAAGDWLRFGGEDGTSPRWVFAQLVVAAGDILSLPVVNLGDAVQTTPRPLQAFYFRSGVGAAVCTEARDGILIQTPDGAGRISFTINAVEITLGSTVFIRSIPGNLMTIDVLEGEVTVQAEGVSALVPAGARVQIPLDDEGMAAGEPEVLPYDETAAAVPLSVLDRDIEAAPPIDEETLLAMQLVPLTGRWQFVNAQTSAGNCPSDLTLLNTVSTLVMTVDGDTIRYSDAAAGTVTLTATSPGVYTGVQGAFIIVSPVAFEGSSTFYPYTSVGLDCAVTNHFQGIWLGD